MNAGDRKTGGKVERREALRPTSLGARGWRYQLREVGTLLPPPRVPAGALAPPAAPPPPAWVRRRGVLANLGRIAPREYQRWAV